jgi:hypothetical protein
VGPSGAGRCPRGGAEDAPDPLDGGGALGALAGLVAVRSAPEHLRMDNGPELIAWALRDWCRLSGTQTSYIEPGAPWENPYVESFNGRVRDELLNLEEFTSLTVAQVVVEAWRIEYNTYRPHSARRPHPRRIRGQLDQHQPTRTLIATGPPTGSGHWSQDSPACLHTAEVTGSIPVTPTWHFWRSGPVHARSSSLVGVGLPSLGAHLGHDREHGCHVWVWITNPYERIAKVWPAVLQDD